MHLQGVYMITIPSRYYFPLCRVYISCTLYDRYKPVLISTISHPRGRYETSFSGRQVLVETTDSVCISEVNDNVP